MKLGRDYIQMRDGEIQIYPSGSVTASDAISATGDPHRWTITTHTPSATDGFLATPTTTGSWLTLMTPYGGRFNIAFASSSITSGDFPLSRQSTGHVWHTASLASGSLTANNIASAIHTAISTTTIARAAAGGVMKFSSSLASNVVTVDVPITGSSRFVQDPVLSSSYGVVIATTVQGTGDPDGVGTPGTPDTDQAPPFTFKVDPDDPTSFMISGSGGSMLYMSGSGKIGIGTKNPTSDFEVAGTEKAVFTKLKITGATQTVGDITSSGNISSSGNVYAADYFDNGANINTLYAPVLGSDDNYVTDAEKTVIGNTSNTNSGNETTATVNALNITEVGALDDGTIAAGFGTINTGEITATSIKHSISGNNAGDYGPGAEILYGISSETTTVGAIYTLRAGVWTLIDANTDNRVDRLCAVAVGTNSSTHGMLIRGCVTLASAFTAGTDVEGVQVYASETAGQATITAPSDSGDLVRILGYSLNVSSKKMFFNPDSTFLEIA